MQLSVVVGSDDDEMEVMISLGKLQRVVRYPNDDDLGLDQPGNLFNLIFSKALFYPTGAYKLLYTPSHIVSACVNITDYEFVLLFQW